MNSSPLEPVAQLQDERFMRVALNSIPSDARRPFACVLVDLSTQSILERMSSATDGQQEPHVIVEVMRQAATAMPRIARDRLCLYSTAEPCPVCLSAMVWFGVPRLVFGIGNGTLKRLGYTRINISASEFVQRAPFVNCTVVGGVLATEVEPFFRGRDPSHPGPAPAAWTGRNNRGGDRAVI